MDRYFLLNQARCSSLTENNVILDCSSSNLCDDLEEIKVIRDQDDFHSKIAAMSFWDGAKNPKASENPTVFEGSFEKTVILADGWMATATTNPSDDPEIVEYGGVIYRIANDVFISGSALRNGASQFFVDTAEQCAVLCSERVPECGAWTLKKQQPLAGYCYLKQTLDIGQRDYVRRSSNLYDSGFATIANLTHCRGNDFNRDSIFDLEKDLQGCWELADDFIDDESKLHYCQPARESGCYALTCTETEIEGASRQFPF